MLRLLGLFLAVVLTLEANADLLSTRRSRLKPYFLVEVNGAFSGMDAVDDADSQGTLTSKGINPGGRIAIGVRKKKWTFQIGASFAYTDVQTNSTIDRLTDHQQYLWRVALEVGKPFGQKFYTQFATAYGNQLFLTRSSPTTLAVRNAKIPEVSTQVYFRLTKGFDPIVGPYLGAGFLFPTKTDYFDVQSGFMSRLGAFYEFKWAKIPFQLNAFYQNRIQGTSLSNWRIQELGVFMVVGLNFFAGAIY